MPKRSGGVCAFVKSSIGFKTIEELDNSLFNVFGRIFVHLNSHVVSRVKLFPSVTTLHSEYLISSLDTVFEKNPKHLSTFSRHT